MNLDEARELAQRYETLKDFRRDHDYAYKTIKENGWEDVFKHFKGRGSYRKWSFEECQNLAAQCTTLAEFRKNHRAAFMKARRENWLPDITSHMETYEYVPQRTFTPCSGVYVLALPRLSYRNKPLFKIGHSDRLWQRLYNFPNPQLVILGLTDVPREVERILLNEGIKPQPLIDLSETPGIGDLRALPKEKIDRVIHLIETLCTDVRTELPDWDTV
jgi:hypothetical protein